MRLVPADPPAASAERDEQRLEELVESYRQLADVFHDILAEQSLDALLERIADTIAVLVPHDDMHIYEANAAQRTLVPVFARGAWQNEIMRTATTFGEGITGWAVEHHEPVLSNDAHLDPRVKFVPGTPNDPEALISIPLVARNALKGALNLYRIGADAEFTEEEFQLAKRFGDAAALALDNAHIRASLEYQAQTDSLTGLYNHRYFHERLGEELRRASRTHASVSLLMLDIDDFKRVNDVYGHGVGDEILRELAEALRSVVRGTDIVCRLGGEEFGVIVNGSEPESAQSFGERISDTLTRLDFEPAGQITVSIGIAHGPEDAMNPRELVACAEAAMMTAKARGKNQIVFFGDDTVERPDSPLDSERDVRSIAHLKMLQSLTTKLNRLNSVREIGLVIADELRSLIDYHNCRVFVVDGVDVIPIAFRGGFTTSVPPTIDLLSCKLGEGITGHVAQTGESLAIPDAARCEFAEIVEGTQPIDESQVAVPLRYGARVTGVIVISKLGLNQFDEDDKRLLEVLGGHASVALENARLYEAERREAESAKALLEFSRELATAGGLQEILGLVVELSAAILGSPRTSVWLQDPETGELVCQAAWGENRQILFEARFEEELARSLVAGDTPFLLRPEDLRALPEAPQSERAVLVAPISFEGDRFGCVSAEAGELDDAERNLQLLGGIAHQAQLAIANAGSFASLEDTFLSTVEALANALEANDEYTSSHARWITDLALKVGRELGLDSKALKRLELGALFHDIGKIGIPGSLLAKPGPLTPEERRIIETHPELGEKIIAPIGRLQEVRAIVRHCHERYDGCGYPDRMGGDEIPLESRIIFVCDAFHAMTTDRPYRKRLTRAEAFRRLREGAGTQFDPLVVEKALPVLEHATSEAA